MLLSPRHRLPGFSQESSLSFSFPILNRPPQTRLGSERHSAPQQCWSCSFVKLLRLHSSPFLETPGPLRGCSKEFSGVRLLLFLKASREPTRNTCTQPSPQCRVNPQKAGEAGPKEEVCTGGRGDSIKWRESKGQRKCILIECLQRSVPPLKRPLGRTFPWRA